MLRASGGAQGGGERARHDSTSATVPISSAATYCPHDLRCNCSSVLQRRIQCFRQTTTRSLSAVRLLRFNCVDEGGLAPANEAHRARGKLGLNTYLYSSVTTSYASRTADRLSGPPQARTLSFSTRRRASKRFTVPNSPVSNGHWTSTGFPVTRLYSNTT